MKKIIKGFIFAIMAFLGSANIFASEKSEGAVERYAIYIGSNEGGNNKRLMYAGTDAASFQNIMSDIGGIRKSNSILLLDPEKDDVDNAMEYISELINKNKESAKRSEFVFYYSGHSDENALLLGKNFYDYSSLKATISNVPSDVHVVILDSCYSGNFIRTKGGLKQKPFLLDDSSVIKGHAYLSSSSSQEFSQESDEIGSSFFTNAMITGLRGAADSSGDKKVTLNELYSYAFSETLSNTENSSAGPQHPNYNITLVGSGDLVLSDISESDCILTLKKELTGRVIIRDKNGKLISEINKTSAGPVYLAMEEGSYGVTVIAETITLQGTFKLTAGNNFVLSADKLSPVLRKSNALRGEDSEDSALANDSEEIFSEEDIILRPVTFSFFNSEFFRREGKKLKTNLSFGILGSETYETDGAMFAFGGNWSEIVNGVQAAYVFNSVHEIKGAQGAGIFNYADEVLGAQGAGILNIAGNVKYAQGAGIVNVAKEKVTGAQGSGVFNYAGNVEGVQGTCVGNISKDNVRGAQGAMVLNVAGKKVDGFQGSMVFNYAGSVHGVQAGLVNVCTGDVDGLQLGLVNFSKNGIFEIGQSFTTENEVRVTLNSGKKYLYSVVGLAASWDKCDDDTPEEEQYATIILGLGTRLEVWRFNFDFEVLANDLLSKDENSNHEDDDLKSTWYPSLRTSVGFSPVKHLQFFAGAMMSFEVEENDEAFEMRKNTTVIHTSDSHVKLHSEFDFGVRFQL